MRRSRLSLSLLVSLVVGCHAHIILPGREDEYAAASGCSGGVCMPTHPLQVFVLGVPANREVHINLLNPHGDDEECEAREEDGDHPVTVCSYRVVRGFSAPYYFIITISPARDVGVATCSVNPTRVLVHRLDRYVRFEIERVRVEEGGSCTYIAREQRTPSST